MINSPSESNKDYIESTKPVIKKGFHTLNEQEFTQKYVSYKKKDMDSKWLEDYIDAYDNSRKFSRPLTIEDLKDKYNKNLKIIKISDKTKTLIDNIVEIGDPFGFARDCFFEDPKRKEAEEKLGYLLRIKYFSNHFNNGKEDEIQLILSRVIEDDVNLFLFISSEFGISKYINEEIRTTGIERIYELFKSAQTINNGLILGKILGINQNIMKKIAFNTMKEQISFSFYPELIIQLNSQNIIQLLIKKFNISPEEFKDKIVLPVT